MKRLTVICCLVLLATMLSGCKQSGKTGATGTNGQPPVTQKQVTAIPLELSYVDRQGELVLLSLNQALAITNRKVLSGRDNLQSGLGYYWSPDGTEVSYAVQLPNELREVKFVGIEKDGTAEGVRATLKEEKEWDALCSASWSPDGSLLAADYGTSSERELKLLDAATLKQVAALNCTMNFTWSPDGSLLALGVVEPMNPPLPVESGGSVTTVIYSVKDGQTLVVKKGTASDLFWPERWLGPDQLLVRDTLYRGPDTDKRLLFQIAGSQIRQLAFDADSDQVTLVEKKVTDRAKTEFQADYVAPFAWSPDQKWLAFAVFKQYVDSIYVTPAGKYNPVLIDQGWTPEWRPPVR